MLRATAIISGHIDVNKTRPVFTDEQRLFNRLMKDYDPNTRPVFNASHSVNVSVGMTLTQIFDLVSI